MFFFHVTQGLADYFVLALISNNGSHPQTTGLFELNRSVLSVCDLIMRGAIACSEDFFFFSVRHITHEFVVSNKRALNGS